MSARTAPLLAAAALALVLAGCTASATAPKSTGGSASASEAPLSSLFPAIADVRSALGGDWAVNAKLPPPVVRTATPTTAPSSPSDADGCQASLDYLAAPIGFSDAAKVDFIKGGASHFLTLTRLATPDQASSFSQVAQQLAQHCAGTNQDGDTVTAVTDAASGAAGLCITAADGISCMLYASRGTVAIALQSADSPKSTTVESDARKLLALAVSAAGSGS